MYIPNIIEFCESKKYLNLPGQGIELFPMQKIILKTFYRGQPGNEKLELDEKELKHLYKLSLYNAVEKYHSGNLFRELVLVLGRRAGKDFVSSLIALYEVMRLLEIPTGSPFKYYKIAEGNPIFILTVATSSDQAKILFTEIKEKMTSSEYFVDKVGHMEADKIHLLTPEDKQTISDGSIVIMTSSVNSKEILGKRIFTLLLNEVSSYKTVETLNGAMTGDKVYAVLCPSTADFVRVTGEKDVNGNPVRITDSKIISISSPRSEEGMLFKLWNETAITPNRLSFKLPTWGVNPLQDEKKLRDEFKFMSHNEFDMEFGANFVKEEKLS